MPKTIFIGEFYPRTRKGTINYRSRRTGEIIDTKPRVITRSGKRDLIIIPKGTKVIGVEDTGRHYFGKDKGRTLIKSAKVLNKTRVRSKKERAAMFSKMKGRR